MSTPSLALVLATGTLIAASRQPVEPQDTPGSQAQVDIPGDTPGDISGDTAEPDPWVVFEAGQGPGAGKHIVLIAGDEEYRSEEALPMLARILAVRHGFRCTVLFSTNPEDGTIDPRDIAPTAAVSFTISHIAAVVLPALLGLLWLVSPAAVFLCGTGFAVCSLILSQLIPAHPEPGNETLLVKPTAQAAE